MDESQKTTKIYFVRHGESEANVHKLVQNREDPLTEKGREQVNLLAKRLRDFPIESILTSSYTRAHETASLINDHLALPLESTDLFGELLYPSGIHGKRYEDEARDLLHMLEQNYHDPLFRHSDEETFADLKKRGVAALDLLANCHEEHLLVVTHGTFIKMLMGLMLVGEKLDSYQFEQLRYTISPRNTSITFAEHRPFELSRKNKGWRFWGYNDHGHL